MNGRHHSTRGRPHVEYFPAHRREICEFHAAFVKDRNEAGDTHLHHYDGLMMLGPEPGEFTVDGVHPTDAGFVRIADTLEPVVRGLLA